MRFFKSELKEQILNELRDYPSASYTFTHSKTRDSVSDRDLILNELFFALSSMIAKENLQRSNPDMKDKTFYATKGQYINNG